MQSRNFRYRDPVFPSYGKAAKSTPEAPAPVSETTEKPKNNMHHISFEKLKNLNTDDYILLFLIFMLIKDNEKPDWPLIASLGYILFDFDD